MMLGIPLYPNVWKPTQLDRRVNAAIKSHGVTRPETNIAPENGWLEYCFPFGARPIFRCELPVLGRVYGSSPLPRH